MSTQLPIPKQQPDKPGRWRFTGSIVLLGAGSTEEIVAPVNAKSFAVVEIGRALYPTDEDTDQPYFVGQFSGWWVEEAQEQD